MKLAIAVPTRDTVPAAFANDLAELLSRTRAAIPTVGLFMTVGTLVHMVREQLLQDTVSLWGASHVLWLDSDMTFPPDTALRLLEHNLDAVGCNCSSRHFPSSYTARRDGKRVATTEFCRGTEAVDSTGLAVFLMRSSILQGIPQPWFGYTHPHETEDGWFCRLLRTAGHTIHIDHDLSKEVGHIGQFTYRLGHVGQEVPCAY